MSKRAVWYDDSELFANCPYNVSRNFRKVVSICITKHEYAGRPVCLILALWLVFEVHRFNIQVHLGIVKQSLV